MQLEDEQLGLEEDDLVEECLPSLDDLDISDQKLSK
jgi:hypothetical protein